MNNTRRNQIKKLIDKLESINFELDSLKEEIESIKYPEKRNMNMPIITVIVNGPNLPWKDRNW